MNLDRMRRHGLDEVVDAVVVGTGAGGAPLLARLAEAGLRVVALEAGRNLDPADFTPDETASIDLYWTGERLSGGSTPEAFGGNNSGVGVGGSTLHWGAFVPRADARDLRLKTESGVGEDWLLKLDDLRPYYEAVEAFIGVSGPSSYPWEPSRRYPLAPVARNAPAEAMARGCERTGIRYTDAPAAVLSRPFASPRGAERPACVNCGACHQGCFNGAKTSMDVTYLPRAVQAGAEIRPDSTVHTIERDCAGRVTGVVYRTADGDRRQRCAALILCGGAIETPRLLLHNGLGNSSGQVGQNYMAHLATQVWGFFETEMRMNKGYPSSLITEDFIRPDKADFAGGYLLQSLGVLADDLGEPSGAWRGPMGIAAGRSHRSLQLRRRDRHERRVPSRCRQSSHAVGRGGCDRRSQGPHHVQPRRQRAGNGSACHRGNDCDMGSGWGPRYCFGTAVCAYHRHLPHGTERR